ncbi:MAG: hypothetical protein ACRDRA_16630 [Pseudonocardiaceae bacterium]
MRVTAELRGQAGFAQGAVWGGGSEGDTFERDGLMQELVGGLPHHTRPAGTDLLL